MRKERRSEEEKDNYWNWGAGRDKRGKQANKGNSDNWKKKNYKTVRRKLNRRKLI